MIQKGKDKFASGRHGWYGRGIEADERIIVGMGRKEGHINFNLEIIMHLKMANYSYIYAVKSDKICTLK